MTEILNLLAKISEQVPIEIFSLMGGFIEELIAPIPSPFVTTLSGTLAARQGYGFYYVIFISFLAAIGKTLGSIIIYIVADKAEDIFLTRFGKFLGISHKEVENFGAKFDKSWKDDIILIALRAIPVFPGGPVTVVCGLIKLNFKTFVRSTFVGVWVRSILFGTIGYYGLGQLSNLLLKTESIVDVVVIIATLAALIILVYKNKKRAERILIKIIKK